MASIRHFQNQNYLFFVLDEGHRIEIPKQLNRQLTNINAHRRLLLTGTPIQNTPNDAISRIKFLNPNSSNLLTNIRPLFSDFELMNQLTNAIEPCMLRRLKSNVLGNEIPYKNHLLIFLP